MIRKLILLLTAINLTYGRFGIGTQRISKISKTKHDVRIAGAARLRNKRYLGSLFVDGSLEGSDLKATKIKVNASANIKDVKCKTLKINGSSKVKRGTVDTLHAVGSSTLKNITANNIMIIASATIADSKTNNLTTHGSLSATNLEVENKLVVHAGVLIQDSNCNHIKADGTLILINTKVKGSIVIGESVSNSKRIVKLKGNTIVHDIIFDDAGEVHIFDNAKIMGKISNGKIIKKTDKVDEFSSETEGISRVE